MVELEGFDLSEPESELVPKIMKNLHTVGFFVVKNVPNFEPDQLYSAINSFYQDVPDGERLKLATRNFNSKAENIVRGILPFVDNAASHREIYDMGLSLKRCSDEALKLPLYEDTPFPPQEEFKWIQEYFEKQLDMFNNLSIRLMELIALGLGKDRDYFTEWFREDHLSTFRVIHI